MRRLSLTMFVLGFCVSSAFAQGAGHEKQGVSAYVQDQIVLNVEQLELQGASWISVMASSPRGILLPGSRRHDGD